MDSVTNIESLDGSTVGADSALPFPPYAVMSAKSKRALKKSSQKNFLQSLGERLCWMKGEVEYNAPEPGTLVLAVLALVAIESIKGL